ncbi:MAG: hypothetical protein A3E78_13800 [Alphaproteobacteria bacterium RIFCSPHIGHO2_12_FULL_63_12]|nr:MAG: hypothetical protein A3E78_13800 [Alphaproteobacteria bacterium RIFCSPHIGHO2_12_FULL_63_12]
MAVTAGIDGQSNFRINEPGVSDSVLKLSGTDTVAEGGIEKHSIANGATLTVNFGSVGTGAKWFGFIASDELTLKVNGQTTGILCDFALFRSTDGDQITSATLANATGAAVAVDVIVAGS